MKSKFSDTFMLVILAIIVYVAYKLFTVKGIDAFKSGTAAGEQLGESARGYVGGFALGTVSGVLGTTNVASKGWAQTALSVPSPLTQLTTPGNVIWRKLWG